MYDQWNYIEIERAGHTVTLSVSTEAGPGEVRLQMINQMFYRYVHTLGAEKIECITKKL